MAMDDGGYLGAYRRFFINFVEGMNPEDQLPVKMTGHDVTEDEIVGEIIDMALQYLNPKYCPSSLQSHLIRVVIEEMQTICRQQPEICGFKPQDNTYAPLRLMQTVTGKVNEICKRYLDNSRLALLPPPPSIPLPIVTVCGIRNGRRTMEDRHVILHDLNTIFKIKDECASYYAVFDGHAGQDAAIYCAAHLHQYLGESVHYPTDMERALRDAFVTTDAYFIQKSKRYNLSSGTTAVCAVIFKQKLYVAWAGDSQAALVKRGNVHQLVNCHRPDKNDEKDRVEKMGGTVIYFGMWRVNGHLAVSRAIGDAQYKPYVTADPDIRCVMLDGTEDFLIVACDGLWDYVSEEAAAKVVYQLVHRNPHNPETISQRLAEYSKSQGSSDNITVIVVFLTPPTQIAARPLHSHPLLADVDLDNMDENNEYLSNANGEYETQTSFFKQAQNRATINVSNFDEDTSLFAYGKSSNGKIKNRRVGYNNDEDDDDDDDEDDEEDDDLGPETDVDAVDDAGEINTLANVSRELFLDKDSADDFNCENTVDDDTPMISSITKPSQNELIAEPENVGDSEESDDEWNYYKVDSNKDKDVNNIVLSEIEAQSESVDDKFLNENNIKLQPEEIFVSEKEQQQQLEDNEIDSCSDSDTESERKVCSNDLINSKISEKKIKEPVVVQVTADNPEDMDFQLNPDAAEFIPVSPVIPPRLLDRPISGSPLKQTPTMDDIRLPSPKEFSEEANHRPHEVESMINSSNDDFIASSNNDGGEFVEKQKILFNLDESEISSTRAEFGDESTASFLTAADYSKNDGMDGSFTNSCISTCDNGSMMMSFGPGAFNPLGNPVDLNAVHDLSDTDLCDSNDQTLPIDLQENNWEKDTNHFNKSDDRDVHSPDIHPELVNLISPESDQPPHSKAFPDHQGDDLFSPSSPVLKSNPNIDEFHEQVESISSEVAAMNLKNDQLSEVHDDKSQSLNISSVLSDVNEEIPKTESLIEQPLDTDDLLLSQPPVTHMEVDDHSSPGLQSNSSLDHCSEETVKISISKSNEIQQQYQVDLKSNDSVESFYPKFHLKGNDIDVKDCELDEKEDETGVKESQIDLKQIEESIISRENHTTSSHVKVFENTLETTSLLHDKHESTIDESIDDSQEKMKITFEDDDDPICQQFDSTTGDSFSRLLSPTMKPQEKHKENIECTLPPIESQVLNALSDTTLELSKSVQEFTGIENELIPMTNGNASKAEIQAPETTICEPVIKDVCQKSQNETIPTLSITEDIVKLTAEEEPINTSQKPTIVASVAAITSDTTVGAIINSTADVKFRSTTKSSQKIAARTVSTKSNNKLSPTSPTKVSTSVPSRPKSSPITKKTITTTIAPTAARSKPAEVTSKSSLTVNKSPTAIKSTVKPLAPKPKSTILKTSSAVVEKKSSGTITINGDTTKSAAAKLPSKPRVTGTSITSKPSAKSTTISVRSTTGLTAKSKPTVGSTAARVVTKTSSGVTSTIGAVAAAPTRPKTAPATLGIMKSRVQSSTKSPTLDKQIKETANKQISSSRTSTTTTAARASRSSNFSVTTSTSSRRTTTTTTTAANKKPMVVTRMSGKSATALSKTSAKTSNVIKNKMQNGMCETKDSKVISEVTTATTTITVTNEQEILQKDLSPIDPTTDNQLLISVD